MTDHSNQEGYRSRLEVYEIGEDFHLRLLEDARPDAAWLRDATARWVSLRDYEAQDVMDLCQACGIELTQEAIDIIRQPPRHPWVLRQERVLIISFPFRMAESARRSLVICGPTTILTFHQSGQILGAVGRLFRDERRLRGRTPVAVLLELIDRALQEVARRAFALRGDLVALTEEREEGEKHLPAETLLSLKQDATGLEIQLEDFLFCISELSRYDSAAIGVGELRLLSAQLETNLERGLDAIERLKSRIGDLHQYQVRQADETTNRRLKILTVLSAVYLPPTLIAGIYGMNFEDIPITSIPFGYAVVILIMASIVGGQLIYFFKRGWFD
jgi:magnesium transporter